MSEDAVSRVLRGPSRPSDADPEDCPVIALGHRENTYYFLTTSGEVLALKARDLTLLNILALFGGETDWLLKNHGKVTKLEKPTGEIDAMKAATALMRRCGDAGLFRLDTPRRLVGVWRKGAEVVAHCGDTLFLYRFLGREALGTPGVRLSPQPRRRMRVGQHLDGALYLGAPPIEPPDKEPATADEARQLRDWIDGLWKFAAPHHGRMVFGFIALGMLGAAPQWRVHVLLTGIRGQAGKTTLLKLLSAAIGPMASYTNDPTEAGLRELLTNEARTIVFDEAGAQGGEDRGFRIEAIIGLLRRMAGDEGARSVRGTGSGARHFLMAGSAVLAAANAPTLDAQDRSRILEVEMLPTDPANKERADAAIARAEGMSARLRARALQGFARFEANLKHYRKALAAIGCDTRQADQLGTLFAAGTMMTEDGAVEDAAEDVKAFRDGIVAWLSEDDDLANARRCLGCLMSTQIEHWKGGAKSTIGRLVQLARAPGRSQEVEALKTYGLRLEIDAEGHSELWVANQHRGLDKVFAFTDWRNGGWRGALKQLAGARPGGDTEWFDGSKVRYVIVPEGLLPPAPKPNDEQSSAPL